MEYQVLKSNPTASEYRQIRIWCGLAPRPVGACESAIDRSLFSVCLRHKKGELIGLGRVVGDLGSHVQVADIAIKPEYQKRGLSRVIMNEVMSFIDENVPREAFVNLFADVDYLYQKYGFTTPKAKGMYLDRNRWDDIRLVRGGIVCNNAKT